jgi:hypothetical protein
MPHSSAFKFFVPFTKAYVDKSTNKMMVEGLASTTGAPLGHGGQFGCGQIRA